MGLKIGLTYNLKQDFPSSLAASCDSCAECESEETVEQIAAALKAGGHKVTLLPFSRELASLLPAAAVDLVFNIAEGWTGRNRESLVPALLELLEIPYTGSDPLTLGLALDKALCKQVVAGAGVPTAEWMLVRDLSDLEACNPQQLSYPLFVKPNEEGSSKGIRHYSRVESPAELKDRIGWVLETYRQPALVETFLPGREFSIGILGNDPPQPLPVLEVLPGQAEETEEQFVYSYEVKQGNLETLICPANIEPLLAGQLQQMAVRAYQAIGCRDVARVDFRVDDKGWPRFLEINPLPGLSASSLFPLQGRAAGMELVHLVNRIVAAAVRRYPHLAGLWNEEEAAGL